MAAMEAMQAFWAKPCEAPAYPKLTPNEAIAVRTNEFVAYAKEAKKSLWCSEGKLPIEYNLLQLRSFQNDNRNGRPDLADMTLLAPLIALLLGFGPDLSKPMLESVLTATHAKQKLREPAQADDGYWLGFQAKALIRMRSKCLFIKKYPDRIQFRLQLQPPETLEVLARLLAKMTWQPVLCKYTCSWQAKALLQPLIRSGCIFRTHVFEICNLECLSSGSACTRQCLHKANDRPRSLSHRSVCVVS